MSTEKNKIQAKQTEQSFTSGFPSEFSRKHGCAWVVWGKQLPRKPSETSGWASIGGEPAFEFQRLSDLPKDVVWWTNLSKSEAWSVGRLSHIKHSGFLGPDWQSIMSEWGFPNNQEQLKLCCSAWAEIFARIGEWLARWSTVNNQPSWAWGDGDFHESLAERLDWSTTDNDMHNPALDQAFLDKVEIDIMPHSLSGQRKINLIKPRLEHAKKILATRYPKGKFTAVPSSEWPEQPDKIWDWAASQKDPVLLCFEEVVWRQGYHAEAALWWGMRGRRFSAAAMDPVWLTLEDALEMRQYIESTPSSALRADDGWQTQSIPNGFSFPATGWLADNSIVSGLLMEALWRAGATPVRTPTKRVKSIVNPRSVWWRSADRRIMFKYALELQKKGIVISSYGQGNITVLFYPDRQPNWNEIITELDFKAPSMIAQPPIKGSTLSPKNADLWLKSTKTMDPWLWIDRLTHPWVGSKKNVLRPILEISLRSLSEIELPENSWSNDWKTDIREQAKMAVQSLK